MQTILLLAPTLVFSLAFFGTILTTNAALADSRLPEGARRYLNRVQPELSNAIAADANLLREVGAHSTAELATATYDFNHSFHFYRLASHRLTDTEDLSQAMVPTGDYCVPYCVAGLCRAMMCFQYDTAQDTPSLLSIGHVDRAKRLQEGLQRLRLMGAGRPGSQRVVLAGDSELLIGTDSDSEEEFLVPATETQIDRLSSAIKTGRMERVTLAEMRMLAATGLFDSEGHFAEEEHPTTPPGLTSIEHDHDQKLITKANEIDIGPTNALEETDFTHSKVNSWTATDREVLASRRWAQITFVAASLAILAIHYRKRRHSLST